ncbi:MAG: DNA polymerase III subunit gamma/tau [Candidatus Pacebacteria bacterium]|nr:DNA polymerase III subunit gamma/tau [Candidatus Paceibacterota bacterium]
MAWPLKYRPQKFEDLALRDVREQLLKLVKVGSVPQVFLFAGPKGSGKTSTSRIISSVLNKELDEVEHQKIFSGNSFIVNELDAASNRGIDDIRLLKERVSLPPQLGSKAVYILDEAHMLTREAFNALLKLLEEPPEHAVFILATTELHKIPDTIISRANLIKFRKALDEELKEVLERILHQEKIDFEDQAIDEVIGRSGGSFRDAVKLLETVARGEKKLSVASLEVLGSLSIKEELKLLVNAVISKDEMKLVQVIKTLRDNGEDEKYVYQMLLDLLHNDLMKSLGIEEGEAQFAQKVSLFLLDNLIDLPVNDSSRIAFLSLEVRLLDLVLKAKERSGGSSGSVKSIKKNLQPIIKQATVKKNTPQIEVQSVSDLNDLSDVADVVRSTIKSPSPLSDFRSDNLVDPSDDDMVDLSGVWEEFLKAIEEQNLTLAAIMKSSKLIPEESGISKVGVYYKFHKLQLEQQKQLSILQNCAQEVAGGMPRFEFVVIPQEVGTVSVQEVVPSLEKDVSEALL